ncbi:MAG: tRNA (guanosine(46)-N7)-methyltransferase TrmB [Clostridium sp.]|nr:tRNA (guanosine(46)-N7)-methyltransferase TrmB [Prevotella sp.]MCM1429068.1 tRNA (guanosine(46)-N7)-methyltransferase TrmB [Clostridium sp.]MCM1475401.1 tRNA (guanosine(46)-N7)-methyltransferase TrmB [Muribaculaceae bacterium]
MGKNKLKKFAEMATFKCVVECPRQTLLEGSFPFKGRWNADFFGTVSPIVLELGCGKGEYTVGLARRNPDRNYIGIDIKGARMWKGASETEHDGIGNAGFLRTQIELIDSFFAPAEVSEIWITFADPQMKKVNKRLTSTRFINLYRKIMNPEGIVSLKTDSPFLYEYTRRMAEHNGLDILEATDDLYSSEGLEEAKAIKTHYEMQWLSRGKTIKLLRFRIGAEPLEEPDVSDLEPDDYRALPRFNPADCKYVALNS